MIYPIFTMIAATDVFGIPVCKFAATMNQNGKCSCPTINCKTVDTTIGNLCASNGITYNSYCDIFHDICKLQIYLYVFKNGTCGSDIMDCPLISQCNKTCKNGLFQTKDGCQRCSCKNETLCPQSTFPSHCTHGFTINSKGCPACNNI